MIVTRHSKTPASRNAEQKWQSLLVVVFVAVVSVVFLLLSVGSAEGSDTT